MDTVSFNSIRNLSEDWGKDERNDLPYSGESVQAFIKQMLNSKVGVFYKDDSLNQYLCFANQESLDIYISDNTRTDLILSRFNTEALYYMNATLVTALKNVILKGSTGNYFKFTFGTVSRSGAAVAENVTVTYSIQTSTNTKTVTARYTYGDQVSFLLDSYLSGCEGNVSVSAVISGDNTKQSTTVSATYYVVNLSLTDQFDIAKVYDVTSQAVSMPVTVTVGGSSTRYLDWYIDGVKLEYDSAIDMVDAAQGVSTLTKYIPLSTSMAAGVHTLQFRAWVEREGQKYYSDMLYKEFVVLNGLTSRYTNYVVVSATIPSGAAHYVGGSGDMVSLTFEGAQKYMSYPIEVAAYGPLNKNDIVISVDDVEATSLTLINGKSDVFEFIPTSTGDLEISFSGTGVEKTITCEVGASAINFSEVTSNLIFDFRANGRSNSSGNKDEYTHNGYEATFSGFLWNVVSGWHDNALHMNAGSSLSIDLAPLSSTALSAATVVGRTIEFEFSTVNVKNNNATICDLTTSGVGIKITAQEAKLTSKDGQVVSTKYKAEENYRIAFVINPLAGSNNKQLAFIYVNGVICGITYIGTNDNFNSESQIVINSTADAQVVLRNIRVYGAALSSNNILNNYILYRGSTSEMIELYNRNAILENNVFSSSLLANQLPVFIITGDIPTLENASNKGQQVVMDEIQYINLQNPSLSFTAKNICMTPQGTSSMSYPKKNFRIYTDAKKSPDLLWYNADGQLDTSRKYSFKQGAQAVNRWCLKADYAESSSTHNTGVARLWNDVMKNAIVGGQFVCRTQAQAAAANGQYPYDVRTTIDGFPVVMFYRQSESDALTFMGKYNFNNDKATESVFGFRDIPGFNNENVQCWEVLNNGNSIALFQNVTDFDNKYSDAFESRYPDDAGESTESFRATGALKDVCTWIAGTSGATAWVDGSLTIADATKMNTFKTQKWDHLDVFKMAAYYVYIRRFGAVDQTVKNAMFTTEGPGSYRYSGDNPVFVPDANGYSKWFFINYDNDTINGVRNDGVLQFDPYIDRGSLDGDAYAYAGHDSVLWNNLEKDDEFMAIVKVVEKALYSAGLTLANVLSMFNEKQSGKWCERVYNQDAQYKYLNPYYQDNTAIRNLALCQGSRFAHRSWWLTERFSKYDSEAVIGSYSNNTISLTLINDSPSNRSFSIQASRETYYGYSINTATANNGNHLAKDASKTFTFHDIYEGNLNIGDIIYIYNAHNLKSLDLSNVRDRLNYVNLTAIQQTSDANAMLESLILGGQGNSLGVNNNVTVLSGIGQCSKLRILDVTGFSKLSTLDISDLLYFEKLYAAGTDLKQISFANGAPVSLVVLPSVVETLKLEGLSDLQNSGISISGNSYANLKNLVISECPKIDSLTFVNGWMADRDDLSGCSLSVDGISWRNVEADDLIALGEAFGSIELKGTIRLKSCTQDQASSISSIFGDNCFTKGSTLFISAPDAVYLSGPATILEGEEGKFTAVVFSEFPGSVEYSITSGSRAGVSINSSTGIITTVENGASDATLRVRAKHSPMTGANAYAYADVQVLKRVYPSSVTIVGSNQINEVKRYNYSVNLSSTAGTITGQFNYAWSLSGDAVTAGKVSLESTGGAASVIVSSLDSVSEIVLSCVIKKKVDNSSVVTGSLTIALAPEGVAIVKTASPVLMSIFYGAGLASNENYMTIDECASVVEEDLKNTSGVSIFKNQNIGDFSEFQYFTNITEIFTEMFYYTTMTNLVFPPQVTTIKSYGFNSCTATSVVMDNVVTFEGNAIYGLNSLKVLNAPKCKTIGMQGIRARDLEEVYMPLLETIDSNGFSNCSKLKKVVFGDVTSFGVGALQYADLQEITLGSGSSYKSYSDNVCIVEKSSNTLVYGSSLCSIIPDEVTAIGRYAFYGSGITSIDLNNVHTISTVGICACNSLTELDLKNVKTLNRNAICECSGLTSINIRSVTTLYFRDYTYAGSIHNCSALSTITSNDNTSGYKAVNNCIMSGTTIMQGCKGSSIPSSALTVGEYAFYSITLNNKLDLSGLTCIMNKAFQEAKNIGNIVLNNCSVKSSAFNSCSGVSSITLTSCTIAEYSFMNCYYISTLRINSGVTIDSNAFYGLIGVKMIYCTSSDSPTFKNNTTSAWANIGSNTSGKVLYVPASADLTIYDASQWAYVKSNYTISATL